MTEAPPITDPDVDVGKLRPRGASTLLAMLSRIIGAGLEPGKMADLTMDLVVQATGAHRGVLVLVGGEGSPVVVSSRHWDEGDDLLAQRDFSRTIIGRALATGDTLLVREPEAAGWLAESGSIRRLGLVSAMAVPLLHESRVVGALYVDSRNTERAFAEEDLELLGSFARKAGAALRQAAEMEALTRETRRLRRQLSDSIAAAGARYRYGEILGKSRAMQEVFKLLERVAESGFPAIIEGESGTGKELVARAIHFNGPRAEAPFVAENCGAVPESLLESELFGHVKGAFTGAERDRDGLFQIADGGTLFLDELEDMPAEMQGKLLRVLENGEVRPVGARQARKVRVRVLAATHREADSLVADGSLRQDLFFRLAVFRIALPPLRERAEDIPLLAEAFVQRLSRELGKELSLSPPALRALCEYSWPGNVRQLENQIKAAATLCAGTIEPAHLRLPQLPARSPSSSPPGSLAIDAGKPYDEAQMLWERQFLQAVLDRCAGDTARAARSLGISRSTLYRKLLEVGIRSDPWEPRR